jgi:chorismate mutase/prephenate dehydratase
MKDLSDWRDEIDAIDREIVSLLNRRTQCVLALAPLKRENKIDVLDPDRERRVHENLRSANEGPLSPEAVDRVFEEIMAAMREIQSAGVESAS